MLQTAISLSADGQKQTVKDSAASRQTHTKTDGVQVDREADRAKKREKTKIEYQADIHANRWVDRQASRQTEAGRLAHADNEMHPHRNNF